MGVFNREFFSINIKKPDRTKCFKFDGDSKLDASGCSASHGSRKRHKNGISAGKKSTAENLSRCPNKIKMTENSVCLSVQDIPKLFSAFPLVGTNSLSFPATH